MKAKEHGIHSKMAAKRKDNRSEPDIMIELCENRLDWCVLLILVDEGHGTLHLKKEMKIGKLLVLLN